MKVLVLGLWIAISAQTVFADALIDPALQSFAAGQTRAKKARVVALLKIPTSNIASPSRYNRRAVLSYLRQVTGVATQNLRSAVQADAVLQSQLEKVEVFWINLAIAADVTPEGLMALSRQKEVLKIYANHKVGMPKTGPLRPNLKDAMNFTYNFKETGLDRLIQEKPELDGRGVLVGHIDTGVDGKHPALQGKIHVFFDGSKIGQPTDSDQHGTHTAGTILGGDRNTNMIGVAPAAKLVSAGMLSSYDEILRGMQWILDPDGKPETNDTPRVVSNSWHATGAPDIELFYRAIGAWEAAGIVPVFSAGNSGPKSGTITRPHEHPDVLAVGATGPGGKIADFSSRGPAQFQGKVTQKPDISAPGVDINSAIPGGAYAKLSGTSMACPHAAGAVALLIQANPKLSPQQIKEILKMSSDAVDESGNKIPNRVWNKAYGLGRLNIYEAVKMALGAGSGARLTDLFEDFQNPLTESLKRSQFQEKSRTFEFETFKAEEGWLTAEQI